MSIMLVIEQVSSNKVKHFLVYKNQLKKLANFFFEKLFLSQPFYQRSHFFIGFIRDPAGQLKVSANSRLLVSIPRGLNKQENEHNEFQYGSQGES